ncbi:acetyl-CoA carboxylase biotin carboxyl carrier protein [Alteraurantiacibacter palmitatis]|uniref:Biotin carboxyl carrier protein of acetyl-CoA carboxylase n=1 Tax=Alteraurantiacibacter palmitatis TaxID=2054628 RepID=A0ABV7E9T8_9SPHN
MTRLTGKDIAEIAKLLDESQFASLDLTMGEFRLRIRRDGGGGGGWADDEEGVSEPAPRAAPRAAAPTPAPTSAATAPAGGPAAGEVDVPAPLLGNYYAAPRPGEPPFVQVGDTVGPDTTIGIIEVMKLMNPIRAGVAGTVTALLAENGKAVEEGQALIRVKVS